MRSVVLSAFLLAFVAGCGDDVCDGASCASGGGGAGGATTTAGGGGAGGGLACPTSGVYHGPWAQKVDGTSAVIRWDACAESDASVVLEPEDGGAPITVSGAQTPAEVTTVHQGLAGVMPDYAGTYWLTEVPVTGLAPATCYTYSLTAEPTRGGRVCTARASGDALTFMAIGDTNPGISPAEEMIAHVLESEPDFVVHLGDIQYYTSIIDSWSQWFVSMQPMLSSGAFQPCIGNHESENPTEFQDYYDRLFADAGFDGTRRWYRFESAGVWFFSVDTESDWSVGSVQGDWLSDALADAALQPGFRGSVVFMHRPIISVADGGNHPEWRAEWEPTFVTDGVVLVLAGHMHGYERFVTENSLTYVVSGGGGGLLGAIDENVTTYPDDAALRVAKAASFNAMRLEVGATSLDGAAIDANGAVLDSFSIPLP